MSPRPLCFVVMPFGQKPDPAGGPDINFDRIYHDAIAAGIEDAGMEPVRADEERTGGISRKAMLERLILSDYVVADLTTANANVFYQLGVRHTVRPAATLTIFAEHQPIPLDLNHSHSMSYVLGENNAFGKSEATSLRESVTAGLTGLQQRTNEDVAVDSPLFTLLGISEPGDIARLKTDDFRGKVQQNEQNKQDLTKIRTRGKDRSTRAEAAGEIAALRAKRFTPLDAVETATAVDLMLTYRALEDWDGMISVFGEMQDALQRQILVREQLGFAYNRRAGKNKDPADRAEALRILTEVEDQQGPSSETCGLIGRIHKDNWSETLASGDAIVAAGHLRKAVDAYTRGYMSDLRDAYPGINAVTLLDIKGDEGSLKTKASLLPVVRFAVEQRLKGSKPDYWDHATMLELAILDNEPEVAGEHLADALAVVRETWEPGTTANNLRMIQRARKERGADEPWLLSIIEALDAKSL
ncbi:MAG: TRAFs-binding domain-containing protein [Pseudomonadota bacterium]